MTDSRVEVLAVPEGSIVWLHNVDLGDEEAVAHAARHLRRQIGHDRFVMLQTNGAGRVDVLGEDELAARVGAALELRTPSEWEALIGCKVIDPDGWRESSEYGPLAWDRPITRADFDRREAASTTARKHGG